MSSCAVKAVVVAAVIAAVQFSSFADGEKIYLKSGTGYADFSWVTGSNWSNDLPPSPDYDYVMDARASGDKGYGVPQATFAGNSLQFGSVGDSGVSCALYQHGGPLTVEHDGMYLARGQYQNWRGSSGTAENPVVQDSLHGKMTVLSPLSAPFRLDSSKHYATLQFPGPLVGASDTALKAYSRSYTNSVLQFLDAGGYYGSFVQSRDGAEEYTDIILDRSALKAITLQGDSTLSLTAANAASTIGDFTGDADTQVFLDACPRSSLTITNSVSGTLKVVLNKFESNFPTVQETLWTNEYEVVKIAAGVTTAGATISVVDNITSSLSDRFEGSLRRVENQDGSVSYIYTLAQTGYAKVTVINRGEYTDMTWIDNPDGWSVAGVPNPAYDYILDSNAKGSDISNYQYSMGTKGSSTYGVFNGRSLEVGDAKKRVNFIHNGDRTFANNGLILANVVLKSWWSNGSSASDRRTVTFGGKVLVRNATANPVNIYFCKKWNTFEFPDEFSGAANTSVTAQNGEGALTDNESIIRMYNSSKYYGTLSFTEPVGVATGYPSYEFSQAAIKGITFQEGTSLTLMSNGVANTIGDCVGATGAKITLRGAPASTLTFTNSVTGPITIELTGTVTNEFEAFERTTDVVKLPAGTTLADVTIVDSVTAGLPSGVTGTLTPVTNPDGSTSYQYTLTQAKSLPIYLVSVPGYDDTTWVTAGNWSNGKVPDGDHDYVVDARCAVSTMHTYENQTFAGNSLQIGSTTDANNKLTTLIHRGPLTVQNEGLFLVKGDIRSWSANGTAASPVRHTMVRGKTTVLSTAAAPFRFEAAKNYATDVYPDEFVGASDTAVKITPGGYPAFGIELGNAAKFYGTILQDAPSSGGTWANVSLDRSALKSLEVRPDTQLKFIASSLDNTIGDLTMDAGSKIVYDTFPVALTITNSLTGALTIEIAAVDAELFAPRAQAWTNEYPVLIIPDNVTFDENDISISFVSDLTLQPGIECEFKKKVADGKTTYYYVFWQGKNIIFSNPDRTADYIHEDNFWDTSVSYYVNPTNPAAANFYYYINTKPAGDRKVMFRNGSHYYTPLISLSKTYINQSESFTMDGTLVVADGIEMYNWQMNSTARFGCNFHLIGSNHTYLSNMRDNETIIYDKLSGDANARLKNSTDWTTYESGTMLLTKAKIEIRDATEYKGTLDFSRPTQKDGVFTIIVGNTGDSAVGTVNLSSNFVFGAYAATDSTTIQNFTIGEIGTLAPVSNADGASCLTVEGALTMATPIKVDCSKMAYPRGSKEGVTKQPVFRWKTSAATLTLSDFTIDETGATAKSERKAWKVWTDGEYTCLGLEILPMPGLIITIQ